LIERSSQRRFHLKEAAPRTAHLFIDRRRSQKPWLRPARAGKGAPKVVV
jgi:hypothetical protein